MFLLAATGFFIILGITSLAIITVVSIEDHKNDMAVTVTILVVTGLAAITIMIMTIFGLGYDLVLGWKIAIPVIIAILTVVCWIIIKIFTMEYIIPIIATTINMSIIIASVISC